MDQRWDGARAGMTRTPTHSTELANVGNRPIAAYCVLGSFILGPQGVPLIEPEDTRTVWIPAPDPGIFRTPTKVAAMQTSQTHPTTEAVLDSEWRAAVGSQADLSQADFGEAVVETLSLGGWRVSDRLIDASDPAHLLGFVERRDGRFEVMQIGVDFAWTSFDTFAQALKHLLTDGRTAAGDRATGSLSWLASLPSSSLDQL